MRIILLLSILLFTSQPVFLQAEQLSLNTFPESWSWTSVNTKSVQSQGHWVADRFRFADADHKYTTEDNASLTWEFSGSSLGIRLAGQNTSSYPGTGLPSHGKLSVYLDERFISTIYPAQSGREFVVANGLEDGKHHLKLVHHTDGNAAGVRIEGFFTADQPMGLLSMNVTAELQEYMNDVRFVVSQNGKVIRSTIGRNWLTGRASMLLPPDNTFDLQIEALGWASQRATTNRIRHDVPNTLPPIYLRRHPDTVQYRFRYPRLNNQAIRQPGEQFTARFLGFDTVIREVRLIRKNQQAVFSRVVRFQEDTNNAFYYDRQIDITLPENTPPGVYDLEIDIVGGRRTSTCRSPDSVIVRRNYPENPKFVTFGHLDTSGQYQAEYLRRIADMANIIGADMVLSSNSVNPAYISGALSSLTMPYLVNFGNHQVFGHHRWYGADLGAVTLGPKIMVLNYGLPWHEPVEPVLALLEQHRSKAIKVINAFEHNAPETLLDDYKVALIHDAHGPGDKLMKMGMTPTQRVGKANSESYRVVKFLDGKVTEATYNHHPTAPIPFERDQVSPLRIEKPEPTTAVVINDYQQAFDSAKVTFVVPNGTYSSTKGRIESVSISDDNNWAEIIVVVDVPGNTRTSVSIIHQ